MIRSPRPAIRRMPTRRSTIRPLVGLALVGLIVASCGSPATATPTPSAATVPTPTPTSTPVPSPTPVGAIPVGIPTPSPSPDGSLVPAALTGVLVEPELANRLPLAVMLDDNRVARPQAGFNAASVVYQATADGYETRYMLVFGEGDTGEIGPVRSARFYMVQWAQEVEAALAHYGGDRRTRRYISTHRSQFTDVDGMGRGNPAYHRIKSRKAPHNAYTSTKELRRVALRLGGPRTMDEDLYRRPFRDPSETFERGASQSIRIPYRTNVITYRFDRDANRYLRSIDGEPHIDPADDKRVTTTNVVVLFQRFRIDTRIEPGRSRPDITTVGTGKAWIFNEGHLVKGSWRKRSDTGPTRLYDADGVEIELVRGRTFFQVVPTGTKITVKE